MNNKKRGNYLALLRKRKGLTQLEVAELLHYSDKNISKWENGKSFPTDLNILNSIAFLYDVPVENIIYGEDNALDKINELSLKKVILKIIKIYLIIVIIFVILLLSLFYKYNNYYVANVSSDTIKDTNIFVIVSKNYNKLKFNKIISKDKEIKLVSFYYEIDNQKYLLFESENEDIIITEYSYYLEYDFISIIDRDCFINILYSDDTSDIIEINFNKYLSSLFT